MKQIIYLLFLLLIPFNVTSQILVNEIFADNGTCCLDDFDEEEDFVEIINLSSQSVDLAGYYFGDLNGGSTIPDGFPELTTIPPGELLVLWYDNDEEQGPLHIGAKLSNNGETIIGINPDGNTIIEIIYGPQYEDISYASLPDGQSFDNGWDFTMCPTPGLINTSCPMVEGCTSAQADNYNPAATIEDGSCVYLEQNGVIINEYGAANCDNDGSDCGDYEDWFELYNNSPTALDLNGYYLSDKIGMPTKWQFTDPFVIPAYGHAVVYASGQDVMNAGGQEGNGPHTNFKLSQTRYNEYLVISNDAGEILNYIDLSPTQLNHSYGRTNDGDAAWSVFNNPSPGNNNQNGSPRYATVPQFDLEAGFYDNSQEISIITEDNGVLIYYTVNGDWPTDDDFLYAEIDIDGTISQGGDPIIVDETTVVRAVVYDKFGQNLPSFVETNTYFINSDHTTYVISVSGDMVDNLLNGNQIKPMGSFEMFDINGNQIDEAVGEFNEHGNDSWAYAQRGFDYITRDQHGYNYAIRSQIFNIKNREEFQRLILKGAANDNYPFTFGSPAHIRDSYVHSLSQVGDLRMDERTHESCVVYVNGDYWGVYDVREKVDDLDFLEYYYDQGEGNVDFLKTWGGTWTEFGDNTTQQEWDDLVDFIVDNDMTVDANYDYVKEVYNTGSLIDYFILNSYVVAMDWLNWNTAWWRGKNPEGDKKKWRYALWDMDATFGHYVNYTGIPDTGPGADPCDPEQLGDPGGQGHVPIINSLFENAEFEADYINRYADLSNSLFSCDFMIAHLDSLIDIITPEMPRQIERWGGSLSEWESNVQELRDFILTRCSDVIVSGMEDCYDVEAVGVTIIIEGEGDVDVNSIELDPFNTPWTGTYYTGIPINLEASSGEMVNFYWEVISGDLIIPDPSQQNIDITVSGPVTIIAHFDTCEMVDSDLLVGPSGVQEGEIAQYSFSTGVLNELEWSVNGGEVLWTSAFDNSIAILWDYGITEGSIVVGALNSEGVLECHTLEVSVSEAPPITNLADLDIEQRFTVYPNPSSGNINILFTYIDQPSKLFIKDNLGRIVRYMDIHPVNEITTHSLDLSALPSGSYYIHLVGSESIIKPIQLSR